MMIYGSSEISEAIQKFERLLSRPPVTNGRVVRVVAENAAESAPRGAQSD